MPKKLIAVTIVRAVFDGVRRDIQPGRELPEGIDAADLDELKRLGAVREEVVEAPPPAPAELVGDGTGEALPEIPPEAADGVAHAGVSEAPAVPADAASEAEPAKARARRT